MDILSNFSERLAELMFFHDEMSSEELAKRTGIAGSSIRAWLRKETVPSYDKLIAVADFFCCSLDFLAGRCDVDERVEPRELPPFYPHLRELMETLGVSRYSVTTRSPIKDPYFTNWSHGQKPLLVTLCSLADVLGVSLDYPVGRADY